MKTIPHKVYHSVHFFTIFFVFVLFSCHQPKVTEKMPADSGLPAEGDIKPKPSVKLPNVKGANESWWQSVQKNLQAEQYNIRWQKDEEAFQSPNPKNNLRVTYKS